MRQPNPRVARRALNDGPAGREKALLFRLLDEVQRGSVYNTTHGVSNHNPNQHSTAEKRAGRGREREENL
jgi:hypothetical protein